MIDKLFSEMLRIRLVEEEIVKRYPEQKMRCPVHLSIGQEAIAVGVCQALKPNDYLISNHRAHAHYLAKGGDLKKMIAEIYGKKTGCSKGRGGSMHLVDHAAGIIGTTPIVGGSIPVGVGVAFASKMRGEEETTVIFLGEGSTEEGVFAESLNFAVLKELPVLFVCENNLYSVYSPLSVRQSEKRDRVAIAKAHGLETFYGDGNDVMEVYELSKRAAETVKKGPVFMEFSTYRHREHCGPNYDNHIGYRTEAEYLEWEKECPIKRYAGHESEAMRKQIEMEIEEAFTFADMSPSPSFDPQEEVVYA